MRTKKSQPAVVVEWGIFRFFEEEECVYTVRQLALSVVATVLCLAGAASSKAQTT